jgi:crotonobetainyl-CoA:carnitine CoA-transferase CaiB-like acyl-CoA transferase
MDIAETSWFRDATERSARVDELYDILAEAMPARGTADWLATFERLDIPAAPVRLPEDLLNDPHLTDVGFFEPRFATETPVTRSLRQAVNVEDLLVESDLPPPMLGADTAAVLREAGLTEEEIAAAMPRKAAR